MYFFYADQESDYVTNGVRAELMIGTDGVSILGIRVLWRISSVYTRSCQYPQIRVEINPGGHAKEVTVSDTSAEFFDLECNKWYIARVQSIFDAPEIDSRDIGAPLINYMEVFIITIILTVVMYDPF